MRSEKGFSLLENLVALAVLGIIAVVLLSAVAMAARSNIISDERTTVESLGRNQMDYVQNLPYNMTANPPVYGVMPDIPAGYSLTVAAARLDPQNQGLTMDRGLQRITVSVYRGGTNKLTLTDYKVNR